ncbi:MAG TPA: serine/threonine-protein kinase [Polyangiaceae bacterium]|jgi:serine/threonine-protein kinase
MSVARSPTPLNESIPLGGRRHLKLLAELGRGSVATVYRGVVETEGLVRRKVAVKLFDLSVTDDPEAALASLGEAAQRAAHVAHPNVVGIHELIVPEPGWAALILDLVEGVTLERFMARYTDQGRRVALDQALFITAEIAQALSGARIATTPEGAIGGLSHLDVAPHQVLLSHHGEVKLSDFGLAQVARGASGVRSLGTRAAASWASVAPEIAKGRPGDARSDVFSLGLLLREMLIGPRFPRDLSAGEVLEHAREGRVPPTFLELQLAPEIAAILRRALEPDPSRRYAHATAMAFELRRVALSMGVGDGRVFLAASVVEAAAAISAAADAERPSTVRVTQMIDEATTELFLDLEDFAPRPEPDRPSGLIRKADPTSVVFTLDELAREEPQAPAMLAEFEREEPEAPLTLAEFERDDPHERLTVENPHERLTLELIDDRPTEPPPSDS